MELKVAHIRMQESKILMLKPILKQRMPFTITLHEKNQIKVPSISRMKIDQFQEQAIDSVLNMQTIWLGVHSTIT